jgi:predicted flap endonuclease-1-like 5' DNA nuclease
LPLGASIPPRTGSSPPSGSTPATIPSGSLAISAEARALHLANQLVQVRQDLASAQADLRNARSERDGLRAELARSKSRIEELEAAAAGAAPNEPPPPAVDPDLEQRLRGRINELEAALAKARAQPAAAEADFGDLKLVRGIGPKLEKALKAQGVTSVRQIADWSDADVVAVAEKIGLKAGRIRKEDWVGSAKRALGSA